MHAVLTSQERS